MNSKRCIVGLLVGCLAGVTPTAVANIGGAIGSNGGGGGGGGGGGLDESAANALYLRQDGTQTLKGNLIPDADGTRDIGSTGTRAGTLWVDGINAASGTGTDLLLGGTINAGSSSTPAVLNIRNNLASGSYLNVGSAGTGFLSVSVAAPARVNITATKLNLCSGNSASCGLTASGTTHPEVRVTDDAGFCVTTDSGTTCNTTITGAGFVLEAQQSITIADNGNGTPALSTTGPAANSISVTCNDTDGCNWNPVLGGAANGTRFCLSNVSANTVTISDGGIIVVQGASIALGQKDSACFHTVGGEFLQTSLSDN